MTVTEHRIFAALYDRMLALLERDVLGGLSELDEFTEIPGWLPMSPMLAGVARVRS